MLGSWFLLKSSVLARVRYDEAARILEIELLDGNVYQYRGVPAFKYQELKSAASAGSYFNSSIKPFHRFTQIR